MLCSPPRIVNNDHLSLRGKSRGCCGLNHRLSLLNKYRHPSHVRTCDTCDHHHPCPMATNYTFFDFLDVAWSSPNSPVCSFSWTREGPRSRRGVQSHADPSPGARSCPLLLGHAHTPLTPPRPFPRRTYAFPSRTHPSSAARNPTTSAHTVSPPCVPSSAARISSSAGAPFLLP